MGNFKRFLKNMTLAREPKQQEERKRGRRRIRRIRMWCNFLHLPFHFDVILERKREREREALAEIRINGFPRKTNAFLQQLVDPK